MEPGLPIQTLLRPCLEGDDRERAWIRLVAEYDEPLFVMAYRVLGPGGLREDPAVQAQDVANMVWTKLWRNDAHALRAFRGESEKSFRSYLFTMTRHTILDARARASAQRQPRRSEAASRALNEGMLSIADPGPGPDDLASYRSTAERVDSALETAWQGSRTLPRDLVICQMYFQRGLTPAAIVSVLPLDLTVSGVEKIVTKARKILQRKMGGPGARSIHIDDGRPTPSPEGAHFRSADDVRRFVTGSLPAGDRDARIRHLSRCEGCRLLTEQQLDALVADPSPSERAVYRDQAGSDSQLRALEVMGILREDPGLLHGDGRPVVGPLRTMRRIQTWAALTALAVLLIGGGSWAVRSWPTPTTTVATLMAPYADTYPLERVAPLRLAQDFSPDDSNVTRGLAPESGEWEAVEQQFLVERGEMLKDADESVAFHVARGHLKLASADYGGAALAYSDALALRPDNAEALIGAAAALYQRAIRGSLADPERALERAQADLARVARSNRWYECALFNRVLVALEQDRPELVASLLELYRELPVDARRQQQLDAAVEHGSRF